MDGIVSVSGRHQLRIMRPQDFLSSGVLSANNMRSARWLMYRGLPDGKFHLVISPWSLDPRVLTNPDGTVIHLVPRRVARTTGGHSIDEVLTLCDRLLRDGVLGLGITASLPGLEGMAGKPYSAFSTVWTYRTLRCLHSRSNAQISTMYSWAVRPPSLAC